MSFFLHICILLIWLETTKAFLTYEVAIGININANKTKKLMSSKATSFLELISDGVFVDKSLFIKDILNEAYGYSEIILPHKWGKTTNLNMLKTFLTIQVQPNGTKILPISSTPNYQLFTEGKYHSENFNITLEKPLLISNRKYRPLIDEYLGRFPVIYISFANTTWSPEQNYTSSCDHMIAEAYYHHKYLLEVYDNVIRNPNTTEDEKTRAKNDKEQFLTYLKGTTEPRTSIQHRLQFLAEKLGDHFGNRAYLIIDDYEPIPSHNDSEFESLRKLIPSLRTRVFHQVVLAHTQPTKQHQDRFHDELTRKSYFPYIGFVPKEMDLLYNYFQIPPQEQDIIDHWYCGYRLCDEDTCNPWSISKYLNSRQLQLYWTDTSIHSPYLNTICEVSQFAFEFSRLITGHRCEIIHTQLVSGKAQPFDVTQMKYALLFLYHAAYLSRKFLRYRDDDPLEGNIYQCYYTVSNHEMGIKLRTIFASNIDKLFNPQQLDLLTTTSTMWQQFLFDNQSISDELASKIEQCYKSLDTLPRRAKTEDYLFHAIVMMTTMLRKFQFINGLIDEGPLAPTLDRTFVLSCQILGIIIDVSEKRNVYLSASQVSQYIKKIGKCPQIHRWKYIKIVLFNLTPNGTVHFTSFLTLC